MDGAEFFVVGEGAIGFGLFSLGDFQVILEINGRNAEEFSIFFDASFDIRFQFVRCRNSARFQRAGKCAGQSTGEAGDNVVNGCREGRRIFYAIEACVASVCPKQQRFSESFDVSLSEWPLLLN